MPTAEVLSFGLNSLHNDRIPQSPFGPWISLTPSLSSWGPSAAAPQASYMHLTLRGSISPLSYSYFSPLDFPGVAPDSLQGNQTENRTQSAHSCSQSSLSDNLMIIFCRKKWIPLGSSSQDSSGAADRESLSMPPAPCSI